jgi:hypothetical protein
MIVTFHSNKLESSMSPAEKPSTGFLDKSVAQAETITLFNLSFLK